MFTYKNAPYKIFSLGPKFCWANPETTPNNRNIIVTPSSCPAVRHKIFNGLSFCGFHSK